MSCIHSANDRLFSANISDSVRHGALYWVFGFLPTFASSCLCFASRPHSHRKSHESHPKIESCLKPLHMAVDAMSLSSQETVLGELRLTGLSPPNAEKERNEWMPSAYLQILQCFEAHDRKSINNIFFEWMWRVVTLSSRLRSTFFFAGARRGTFRFIPTKGFIRKILFFLIELMRSLPPLRAVPWLALHGLHFLPPMEPYPHKNQHIGTKRSSTW